jgi:hypothetical protein
MHNCKKLILLLDLLMGIALSIRNDRSLSTLSHFCPKHAPLRKFSGMAGPGADNNKQPPFTTVKGGCLFGLGGSAAAADAG